MEFCCIPQENCTRSLSIGLFDEIVSVTKNRTHGLNCATLTCNFGGDAISRLANEIFHFHDGEKSGHLKVCRSFLIDWVWNTHGHF